MLWFNIITLTPVILLLGAGTLGGVWAWTALIYMTAFMYGIDRLVQIDAVRRGRDGEFPSGDGLSVVLGLTHVPLLILGVLAVGGFADLSVTERLVCLFAFGSFFGQVSNTNNHELIHRTNRRLKRLGTFLYVTVMFGHHVSAHLLVHHPDAGTDADPNTARPGEGFYRYLPRAWIGSFIAGYRAENALRARAATPRPAWTHPYVFYVLGSVVFIAMAFTLGGWAALLSYVALCAYAHTQHLMSDYVQHYGIRRNKLENGKYEPIGLDVSWNAPQFFSSAMMVNAPRHSDHHVHPLRHYPELQIDSKTMPLFPLSLPVMCFIALVPPLFRRIMNPRVAALKHGRDMPKTLF